MNIENIKCTIDKLKIDINNELDLSGLLDNEEYEHKDITGFNSYYQVKLMITHKEKGYSFSLYLKNLYTGKSRLDINPSKIGTYSELLKVLSLFDLKNAEIKEIHHTLDIEDTSLSDFIQKFHIPNKSIINQYRNEFKSGALTGIYFGINNHKVLVYDKDKERTKW